MEVLKYMDENSSRKKRAEMTVPEQMQRELRETLSLLRWSREMMKQQLEWVQKQVQAISNVGDKLDALAKLGNIMGTLNRTVETLSKYTVTPQKASNTTVEDEGETLNIEDIVKGKI